MPTLARMEWSELQLGNFIGLTRLTDDELMIEIQGGNSHAFEEIVSRHRNGLIGFLFRQTRDLQLAEDLAQDTLLKVYQQAWDFLPRGTFKGWIFRIARNLLIDHVRRQSHDALVNSARYTATEEDAESLWRMTSSVLSPDAQAQEKELAGIIEKLLEQIPSDQRQVFLMYHYSELSLPEIALATETTLPTVKSRLRLAREKLRDLCHQVGIHGIQDKDDSV